MHSWEICKGDCFTSSTLGSCEATQGDKHKCYVIVMRVIVMSISYLCSFSHRTFIPHVFVFLVFFFCCFGFFSGVWFLLGFFVVVVCLGFFTPSCLLGQKANKVYMDNVTLWFFTLLFLLCSDFAYWTAKLQHTSWTVKIHNIACEERIVHWLALRV